MLAVARSSVRISISAFPSISSLEMEKHKSSMQPTLCTYFVAYSNVRVIRFHYGDNFPAPFEPFNVAAKKHIDRNQDAV